MKAEVVLDCETVREFLDRAHGHVKAQHPQALSELARLAGFRSASAISMILAGKRKLSTDSVAKLAASLKLERRAFRYVLTLSQFENAKPSSKEERHRLFEEILFLRSRKTSSALQFSQYRFLSVWYYPAIYALAASGDLRSDARQIAARLKRGVTRPQVKTAVGDLINLNLIKLENGFLSQVNGPLCTDESIRHAAIERYHKEMMRLAVESIPMPKSERYLNGLTVLVPKEKQTELRKRLNQFLLEMNELLSGASSGEVHQINIQFFPLTAPAETEIETVTQ